MARYRCQYAKMEPTLQWRLPLLWSRKSGHTPCSKMPTFVINKILQRQIKRAGQKLIKFKTAYQLRKAIILELHAWRDKGDSPSLSFADTELKTAILQQRQLGWRLFLEGLVCKSISSYQQEHMTRHHPKLNATAWTKKIIKATWDFLGDIWQFCNENLHEPHTLQALEGLQQLEATIIKEWEFGLGKLPALKFSHLFRMKKETLQHKSIDSKKHWLSTVKLARDLHNDSTSTEDIFDTNNALRFWIGLPKSKKKEQTNRNKSRKD